MSILKVRNLSHGFGDREIFNDVSFDLLNGEHIGLTGGNGEGKTTFLKLITKNLLPDSGMIEWNSRVAIGYVDQNVQLRQEDTVREYLRGAFSKLYKIENTLESIYKEIAYLKEDKLVAALKKAGELQEALEQNEFYSIESKIEGIASGLGFTSLLDKGTHKLSGGERSKVLLGKLLLEKPDILLLDEPTNHLDEENITWLKEYLSNYKNAFIVISHDNIFLNSVIDVVYHLENRKLTRYVGNYEKFLKLYEERKTQLKLDYINQQKEIARLEDYVRKNKARASTTAMAASREKRLEKMKRIEIVKSKPKPHFDFIEGKPSGSIIFETKNLIVGYDKPLSKPLNLKMRRGEKIALIGANGIGKTTLLKSIIGILEPFMGEVRLGQFQQIGYFEQEMKEEGKDTSVIQELWNEFPKDNQTQIRTKLARCGLTKEHIESRLSSLSGGEQAKVRLCKLINKETNILILDEPTNHLDRDAKEELARALKSYKGSILIVSHEPEFYRKVATDIWNCEDWAVNTDKNRKS
ncbi:ABC-F family ATP-binding cassette domain-containing protein [Clostridium polynesiense]|uniref:ABC-F family ATP-binding cassette domain-containing protein n=1 Tax=Clostridium polynesiense TaxID=1325933 RepID=UPI00058DC8A3|nr:ABC-F family ATP-binding cassette domain-containing protein [Clostridium polynesiense]